jgi:hypothetical protein
MTLIAQKKQKAILIVLMPVLMSQNVFMYKK